MKAQGAHRRRTGELAYDSTGNAYRIMRHGKTERDRARRRRKGRRR